MGYLIASNWQPAGSTKAYSASGAEIALDALTFLPKRADGTINRNEYKKLCGADGNCVGEPGGDFPTPYHAWRILAFASNYKVNPDENLRKQAIAEATRIQYLLDNPGPEENMAHMTVGYGLWQFSEAYKIFKDPIFLKLMTIGAEDILFRFEYEFDANFPDGRVGVPMIHAVGARQLLLFSTLLESPEIADFVQKNPKLFTFTSWDSVSGLILRMRTQAERILQIAEKNLVNLPNRITEVPEFRDQTCFVKLAQLELSAATGNPTHKSAVAAFFKRLNFSKRTIEDVNISVLQDAAACADVLQRLCATDASFCADKDYIVRQLIARAWDSPKAPKCNGDGGFLSMLRVSDGDWCNDNVKATSDSSYGIYIMSQEKDLFDVYS